MSVSFVSWLFGWLGKVLERIVRVRTDSSGESSSTDDDYHHPLLEAHTYLHSYSTTYAKYPSIRTFYHPHAHSGKLAAIADLPLIVIIHGLGGSLPQFTSLLSSLVNLAPTFGVELPGHGQSGFAPKNYEAFTFEALVQLWKVSIEEICESKGHHKVVLIGHSLGCSIAAALTSAQNGSRLGVKVIGMIAVCPKATPPHRKQAGNYRRMLSLPDFVLNILRWSDRLGGEYSNSVKRFVDETAGIDLKRLQLQFNRQFTTPVWKRTSMGLLPTFDDDGTARGGIPGRSTWENIKVPLFIIAGESDKVTKVQEATEILAFVQGFGASSSPLTQPIPVERDEANWTHSTANDERFGLQASEVETETKHAIAVKSVILPSPASHALMYDHSTYRTVAGLIEDFLSRYVSSQLDLGWQLQQLTTSGKWDVKNLQKWKKVLPVSGPIDGGFFRALKILREQDEEHTPSVFLQKWGGKIFAIIDISHDSPVYDTGALEKGGVQYHKFPTVSKIPPTVIEVQKFIELVDRLRHDIEQRYPQQADRPSIAVHCHYGYNRTGFFIVCYLIEKKGYQIQHAVEEFARAKPPGIKHDHFIDTLFVRYSIGLRRSSTSR